MRAGERERESALDVVSPVFQNLILEPETKTVTIATKRVTVNVYVRISCYIKR